MQGKIDQMEEDFSTVESTENSIAVAIIAVIAVMSFFVIEWSIEL